MFAEQGGAEVEQCHRAGQQIRLPAHGTGDFLAGCVCADFDGKKHCEGHTLGAVTDVYQPVERARGLTRAALELLGALRHPVTVVTKSALIERDIDLLAELARDGLVHTQLSVTTLRPDLARRLEPRAASPQRRLDTIARLSAAGIPVGVLVAPVIPVLTDAELEAVLAAARDAGATASAYTLLRLDERGCGLSDRDMAEISFEAWVRDLEAVVDAAGLARVALSGHSQGSSVWE